MVAFSDPKITTGIVPTVKGLKTVFVCLLFYLQKGFIAYHLSRSALKKEYILKIVLFGFIVLEVSH